MSATNAVRRRVGRLLSVTLVAALATFLAPPPAHATLGPPVQVDIQLRGSSGAYQVLVGRVVGTIEFDDGASAYRLSLVVCRQSSYTTPTVRVNVNGVLEHSIQQDSVYRSQICGGHGLSGELVRTFSYPGVVENISIGIQGVYFDGSTARPVGDGAFYPNPYY
ncbi:MAG: hypothetical protein SYR96_21710 [Actinomycetota bacterium]|nr:hypothetical protein [Actinomycetota bacterium]